MKWEVYWMYNSPKFDEPDGCYIWHYQHGFRGPFPDAETAQRAADHREEQKRQADLLLSLYAS